MSDVIVVVAKADPSKGAAGTSLFIIDSDMEGFKRRRILKKLGMKTQDTSELFFDNVKVPKENLLGDENKGFAYLMNELNQERLLVGAMSVASSEAVFEETRAYIKE